ncbi:methyl-accepting chemotaxis protein [uncultured Erythrobacter sp.]|uniref:methyl-accepting chemotaxis protein n=1 Tax=uncultured Erythrobacter sp. TaxID=263913 RepID=UPI00262792A2|nr:methyl-accepting chemotaxis protein [uncultured Erythrobacter sp.]
MNVMTSRDELEEHAVPEFPQDLLAEFQADLPAAEADVLPENAPKTSIERIGWFRDLRLASKIHTIFGSFFAIGFAMSLVLGLGLNELWSRYQVSNEVQLAVVTSSEFHGTTGELRYHSARFIFEREPAVLERRRESFSTAVQQLDKISSVVGQHIPQLSPRADKIQTDLTEYNATFGQLISVMQSEGRSEASEALAYQVSDRGDALVAEAQNFSDDLTSASESIKQTGVDYFFTMVLIVAGLGLIAGLILLLGLSYLSRDFSRKIGEVTEGMIRLTKGDRHFEIAGRDRKDEIGDMVSALDLFKRANRKLETWARERAQRAEEEIQMQREREREREEAEAHKTKLLTEVAQQFERTVGEVVHKVADASSELHSTATKMAETAEETSARTTLVAQDMADANSGATSAAAASDEFALSIGEISRQAATSSDLARLATDATSEADTTISALADSAEQVGQIVELIQTIAQRTNLLALNASIEAARGGEAGRGFAVVASEVKELAMQTSRATEQVADQIRAMQDTTGASVNALRSIAGQVKELETTAVSIASAVDQQSVAGQDLAQSIDLAARGTEKVAGHIEDVRELSLSTGAAASQVLTSANDLEVQASTLGDQVKAFLQRVREA